MTKATINTKSGSTITIEGSDKDIAAIIAQIETPKNASKQTSSPKTRHSQRDSAPDLVIGLKEDDYFSQPRSLGDIVGALAEKGYAYPATTLSGVMINLVKGKILGRKKVDGKWVYGK